VKTLSRRRLPAALTALLTGAALLPAAAQSDFPTKQMRIIVPFTAGGSSDMQARLLADHLGRLYKQTVLVENKPGAGGHIGGRAMLDAPADGHTLMLGSIGLHATYGVYKKLAYNPAAEYKVVTVLAEMPHVVIANLAVPASNLRELAALARKAPGALNFGSAGIGSSVHMIGELFIDQADAPLTHVPYKGSSATLSDLIGGQIQLMFENPPTTLQHIKAGKLKPLAVTGAQRLAALPQVPTAAESGFPGFVATSWTTVAVSAKVPDVIAERINADIRRVVASPDFRQSLQEQGMTPLANSVAEAATFVAAEKKRWDHVIGRAKLTAD